MSLLAGIAAPIVGGAIGNIAGRGDRKRADALRQQALAEFEGLEIPELEKQRLVLERLRSAGELTPEMEQEILQGPSAMEGVATDPRLKSAQLAALSSLQDIGAQDGMSAADKSRFNQMQSENSQAERGSREAIMQDMARRGQSGSGNELVAQLMNQQASAQRSSQQGMDLKAQAEQRALQAIMQSGELGGNIRGQDFNEQSQKAQAADAISRFNTQNRMNVQSNNVSERNNAQAANLDNRQQIANSNVGIANQQQTANKGLYQQQYQNQLQRAQGMAGQLNNVADSKQANAQRTAEMWAGIGSGAGKLAMAYDQNQKKKV